MKKLLLIVSVSVLFVNCEKIKEKNDFRNELAGPYSIEESHIAYSYYNGVKQNLANEYYKHNTTVTKSTVDDKTLVCFGKLVKVYLKDGIATSETGNFTLLGTYEFTDVPYHKQLKITMEHTSGGRTDKYDFIGTK